MEFYYRGTRIFAKKKVDRLGELREYMLVESFEEGYVFQLVCISGYNSGVVFGHIKKDPTATKNGMLAVSKEFLLKELEYNIGEVDVESFDILKKI